MIERTISESWAIFRPDGSIAGDGESSMDGFGSREDAEAELLPKESDEFMGGTWLDYLLSMNRCKTLRVGKIRKVEVIED